MRAVSADADVANDRHGVVAQGLVRRRQGSSRRQLVGGALTRRAERRNACWGNRVELRESEILVIIGRTFSSNKADFIDGSILIVLEPREV